jgi:hypothetical protein
MRAVRISLTVLIFAVPLVILTTLGVLMVRRYYRGAERVLGPTLAKEATNALGHEVRLGRVRIEGGHAYVDDVRIAEGRTLAERGPIATARQVILDFDLPRILFERNLTFPRIATARVIEPTARVTRDRAGRWNFTDIFKPRPGPPRRLLIGKVEVLNGTLYYSDSALPRNPKRPDTPLASQLTGVNGSVQFDADRSVSWQAEGQGNAAQLRSTRVMGTYEPQTRRLFLRIHADHLTGVLANRFLPPDTDLTGGFFSGRVTLVHMPEMRGPLPLDVQADATVQGASVLSSRLGEPVRSITGQVSLSNAAATLRLDVGFAGSPLHVEGTAIGFSKNPTLDGWVTGRGVRLQRVLAALKLNGRYPALRQMDAFANGRADVHGPLNNLSLFFSGPVLARGTPPGVPALPGGGRLLMTAFGDVRAELHGLPNNPIIQASGPVVVRGEQQNGAARLDASSLQVSLSGPLRAPDAKATGMLARVRYRDWEAQNIGISGVYTPRHAAVDFAAQAADGRVAGRAEFFPNGAQTRYRVVARARNVNLSRLPIRLGSGETARGRGGEGARGRTTPDAQRLTPNTSPQLSGLVSADVIAQGRFDRPPTQGGAEVQVSGLKLDNWMAERARARLRAAGDLLYVEPLLVSDEKGFAVATGTADLRKRTLDLRVDADRIDLARLPLELGEAGNAPIENRKSSIENPIAGLVFLREGHVTGTFDEPHMSGTLRGYNIGSGQYVLDSAAAKFEADQRQVVIREGEANRYPAAATFGGVIYRPLSPNPRLSLDGTFESLDLQEIALLAGSDLDAAGTAHGSFEVYGTLRLPRLADSPVIVDNPGLGDYDLDALQAVLSYDPVEEGGTWHLDRILARLPNTTEVPGKATFTGDASITNDRRFTLNARAENVDLSLLEPRLSDYITLSGIAGAQATRVTGTLNKDGKIEKWAGDVLIEGRQLVLNNAQLGDLNADLKLAGREILSSNVTLGPVNPQVPDSKVLITSLRFNRDTQEIEAQGSAGGLSVHMVHQALVSSPYLATHPDSVAAKWVEPILQPFEGNMDMPSIRVTGTTQDPTAQIRWQNRGDMVIQRQAVQQFAGDVTFTHKRIELESLRLTAGEAVVKLEDKGTLVFGESLTGSVQIANLPLTMLQNWFPTVPELAGLSGVADYVYIDAKDTLPSAPTLTVSANLLNLKWHDARVLSNREFRIDHLFIPTAVITEGSIKTDRVEITPLERQAAGAAPPSGSSRRIYAQGSIGFTWEDFFGADPPVDLEVRVGGRRPEDPGEDLAILTAFAPDAFAQLEGRLKAEFTWKGTLHKPQLHGSLTMAQQPGERIRLARMTTALTGLDAAFTFTGDRLVVDRFTAMTQIPRPPGKNENQPITLTGELPLEEGARDVKPLHLSAPRMYISEDPLLGLKTGRLVCDNLRVELDVDGTLFQPDIHGTVSLQQTDFRMPDTMAAGVEGLILPVNPSFSRGIRFVVGNNVVVRSAQLTAQVHTPPGEPIVLLGDLEHPTLNGVLSIERGILAFPTARFTIQRGGEIALRYPFITAGIRPAPGRAPSEPETTLGVIVNLTATTSLTASSVNGVVKRYTITVDARGPLNSGEPLRIVDPNAVGGAPSEEGGMQLVFRSDPPDLALSPAGLRQRITGLLGGQEAIQQLFGRSPDVGRILSEQLTDVLSASLLPELLERLGIARALRFEELSVEYNRLDAFTLRASRQIFGPLYLGYWRRFSNASGLGDTQRAVWELKLSYRIRDNLQFSWTTDDQRTNAYLLEGVFKF